MHGAKELIFKFKDHAGAAFWSLSAAVFVFAVLLGLLGESAAVRWVLAVAMLLVCLGILVWAQAPIGRICASLGQVEEEGKETRQKILELDETCNRLEREKRNVQEECEAKTRQHLDRVAEEQARVAAVLQQAEGSRLEKERLLAEHKRLQQELSEISDRRRLSEVRNQDFDRRLREIGDAHAASAAKLKESEQEILRLRQTLQAMHTEGSSLRKEAANLQRQIEIAEQKHADAELRLSQKAQELELLACRAEKAEERVRYLENDLPAEALAARDRAERLLLDQQAVNKDLEVDKSKLEAKVSALEVQAGEAEQLIKELHERLRASIAEPKPQMADHFNWRVNYFRDNEVVLNFVNSGVPMDLIEATTQPPLGIELPVSRHLERNEEGRIRLFSKAMMPQEFVLRVRTTAFAQEACFRIRAFAENKLERV